MILVTGGTGLVGGHLLYRFRESEHPINAIYRSKDSLQKTRDIFDSYNPGDAKYVDQINWIKADVLDLPSLEKAMKGITTVYHCAAVLTADSFEQMKHINVIGTAHLVNIALAIGVQKFCYVSSIAALGNPIDKTAINEDDFFNPDNLNTNYAISKYGGEMEVWRASQEGLPVVIVNPGIIIGEGNYSDGSGSFFSRTYKGQYFYTRGCSGFIDVKDVVSIMQQLTESNVMGERFILVSENLKFKKFLSLIAKLLGKKPPSIKLPKVALFTIMILLKIPQVLGLTTGLSRSKIKSLTSTTIYTNTKIKETLDVSFIPIGRTLKRVTAHFLTVK